MRLVLIKDVATSIVAKIQCEMATEFVPTNATNVGDMWVCSDKKGKEGEFLVAKGRLDIAEWKVTMHDDFGIDW